MQICLSITVMGNGMGRRTSKQLKGPYSLCLPWPRAAVFHLLAMHLQWDCSRKCFFREWIPISITNSVLEKHDLQHSVINSCLTDQLCYSQPYFITRGLIEMTILFLSVLHCPWKTLFTPYSFFQIFLYRRWHCVNGITHVTIITGEGQKALQSFWKQMERWQDTYLLPNHCSWAPSKELPRHSKTRTVNAKRHCWLHDFLDIFAVSFCCRVTKGIQEHFDVA